MDGELRGGGSTFECYVKIAYLNETIKACAAKAAGGWWLCRGGVKGLVTAIRSFQGSETEGVPCSRPRPISAEPFTLQSVHIT